MLTPAVRAAANSISSSSNSNREQEQVSKPGPLIQTNNLKNIWKPSKIFLFITYTNLLPCVLLKLSRESEVLRCRKYFFCIFKKK